MHISAIPSKKYPRRDILAEGRPRLPHMYRCCPNNGFSIIEMLVALTIATILTGMAISNIKSFEDPLVDGGNELQGFLKQARARGLATTLAYKVRPTTTTKIIAETAKNCSATTWTQDNSLLLNFPKGVVVTSTTWSVCFSARGLPSGSSTITVQQSPGTLTKTIDVYLGGGVKLS